MQRIDHDMEHPSSSHPSTWDTFFSYGFRPFFLGASVYAVVAVLLWLAWIAIQAASASLTWISISGPPHVWHAHEMVFGFGLAAVAGFLLTAVPSWTGAQPLSGQPLAILFFIWLAGRVAMIASAVVPPSLAAPVDLAFIPALGVHVTHQLFVRPQARNMIFVALLAVFFIANAAYHLAMVGAIRIGETEGIRAGLLTLVIVIVIIGGRIVPAFTHNHLQRVAPQQPVPVRSAYLDLASLASTVVFAILTVVPVPDQLVAGAAFLAAAANGVRLALWRGLATLSAPIVAVLHVGYLWIVVGLALWGIALSTRLVGDIVALHALGTGGIGTMVIAVMSRASLGHTGRPLVAPPAITAAYVLVSIAALLRTLGPSLLPSHYSAVMLMAGIAWVAAFGLFAMIFFPILTQPRRGTGAAPA